MLFKTTFVNTFLAFFEIVTDIEELRLKKTKSCLKREDILKHQSFTLNLHLHVSVLYALSVSSFAAATHNN